MCLQQEKGDLLPLPRIFEGIQSMKYSHLQDISLKRLKELNKTSLEENSIKKNKVITKYTKKERKFYRHE